MAEYKDITPLKKQISDVKKAINSPNSDYMTGYICALSVTEGIIAELPTADVVGVRHGEWIYKEIFGIEFPECSVCGNQFEDANCGDYFYCPNCGAKMDGRSDT